MDRNMDFYKDIPEDEKKSILAAAAKCGHNDPHINFIGADDTFDFQCQQCGACCMNRGDIILTGWDVFKAAKYLNISCADFLRSYTTRTLGGTSKMPIVLLKTQDDGFCPFLKLDYLDNGKFKCAINPAKPGACASHPIGMMSSMETTADPNDPDNIKTCFIHVSQCPQSKGHGETHVVREWMSHFIDHQEESLTAHHLCVMTGSLLDWQGLYLMTTGFASALEHQRRGEKEKTEDLLLQGFSMVASMAVEYAYAHFDTSKDFLEQAEENRAFLQKEFSVIGTQLYRSMEGVFNDCCDKTLVELLNEGKGTDYEEQIRWLAMNPPRYPGFNVNEAHKRFCEDGDCDSCGYDPTVSYEYPDIDADDMGLGEEYE